MTQNIEQWIEQLSLTPHPEGGYYKEIITGDEFRTQRARHILAFTSYCLMTIYRIFIA
jgi:predicted cupin superfamily sugar epimerase